MLLSQLLHLLLTLFITESYIHQIVLGSYSRLLSQIIQKLNPSLSPLLLLPSNIKQQNFSCTLSLSHSLSHSLNRSLSHSLSRSLNRSLSRSLSLVTNQSR